jgi:ferredoxin-thioredoxin reductase catalytic subunit
MGRNERRGKNLINRENYRLWAEKNGFKIVEENSEDIFNGLDMKREQFGVAYCPCITPLAHAPETVCPCFICKLIKSGEKCYCGLFTKE